MPTRYLKPGVRDSEAIDALSPLAETLFYRLLVTVDDFGRFDARPAMIKSHCFPVKESVNVAKCAALLEELARFGLVLLYQVDGKPYLQMLKWDNKPRAAESAYPAHSDTCIQTYADADIPRTVLPVTVTGTKTETETETGTVDGCSAAPIGPAKPTALTSDNMEEIPARQIVPLSPRWELPEPWGDDAVRLGWKANEILFEAEKFRQYWTAGKGSNQRRTVKGWRQSWSNWIGKAAARR